MKALHFLGYAIKILEKNAGASLLVSSTLASMLLAATPLQAQEAQAAPPEEIVVTGRLPGPPLWRVSSGDNHLYLFGYLSPIPQDMVWESTNVEAVLARSQEYLSRPVIDMDASAALMMNPLNWVRAIGLAKRLMRNPDEKRLEEVVPPALYQRYTKLRAQYFPKKARELEVLRPLIVASRMQNLVFKKAGLESAEPIGKKIESLVKKQRQLHTTKTEIVERLDGSYQEAAASAEALLTSIPFQQELACFEWQVNRLEQELSAMQERALTWAKGNVDALRDMVIPDKDPCDSLVYRSSADAAKVDAELEQLWLSAAEQALANNRSTFAVLSMNEILAADGLLARLRAAGYSVREP